MLKKNGFKVYLFDEFRTSSYCENRLEKFKLVDNPRLLYSVMVYFGIQYQVKNIWLINNNVTNLSVAVKMYIV